MTPGELLDHLRDHLGAVYPARIAERSNRPGAVTCVVTLDRIEYDPAPCTPAPFTLTAQVAVLSAQPGEQGVRDLLAREPSVAGLVRAAGFTPTEAAPMDAGDGLSALAITATATGTS